MEKWTLTITCHTSHTVEIFTKELPNAARAGEWWAGWRRGLDHVDDVRLYLQGLYVRDDCTTRDHAWDRFPPLDSEIDFRDFP